MLSQGRIGPVWRTLVTAIIGARGTIPQWAYRSAIPAPRERPAPRRSEVRSVTNPRISA